MHFYVWFGLISITHAKQVILGQQPHRALEDYSYVSDDHQSLTLTFDELPEPPNGLSILPGPYPDRSSPFHLQFNGFSLFRPDHPALSHLISENDLNCAISSPHAVLGSRYQARPLTPSKGGIGNEKENELKIASFEIASSSDDEGASTAKTSFELRSMSIKPMDFPSGAETIIFFRGYKSRATFRGEVTFNISFPAGYHLPLHLDMGKAAAEKAWTDLRKVEIWADYGRDDKSVYKGLDWEFCIDDLSLGV